MYMMNRIVPDDGNATICVMSETRGYRRKAKDFVKTRRNYSALQLASKKKIRLNQAWRQIRTCRLLMVD